VSSPHDVFADFAVSRESQKRLTVFVELVLAWQAKINLIAPSTITDIWTRHIKDSLQLLPLIPAGTSTIADLGAGAGFPGVILACVTDVEVHLYEANNKKSAFLREALRVTSARGQVHPIRLEKLTTIPKLPPATVVTARALAPLDTLLALAEPFLKQGAIGLFHKGETVDAELTQAAKSWTIEAIKHPSALDSQSVILEVRNATRAGH
jgi:16S rRNA (guanine527-N7)-methyltransferase